jgi:hypothetical protein
MEEFFSWGESDGKTLKERILKILFFIGMGIIFSFIMCYFIFGLFILDVIYYVITGKTIVWEHINT